MSSPLILLELNELCPSLMNRFIGEGELPHFAAFRESARVFETDAGEDPPHLEPWIQWVTVHTGVARNRHKIHELGEGEKYEGPRVWDSLSDAGLRSWICGSMNFAARKSFNGIVLPDPWSREPVPPGARPLAPFIRFVRANVQEHTNVRHRLRKRDGVRFASFMVRHGLSRGTTGAIVRQLVGERLSDERWRRACLLDRLQADLFEHYYRRLRPDFSTFFLNSTAHFQHLYWRDLEPARFRVSRGPRRETAILDGYRAMDRLLGRFMRMAPKATIYFCTALSQQPHLDHEATGGKVFYRPRDFAALLRALGVTERCDIAPVMAEQFHLDFADVASASAARRKLAALKVDGRPALFLRREGASLFAGCHLFEPVSQDEQAFHELFYQADATKSGRHHRAGMLWIRGPGIKPGRRRATVSLTSIAPTILAHFGVTPPSMMKGKPL